LRNALSINKSVRGGWVGEVSPPFIPPKGEKDNYGERGGSYKGG